MSHGESGQLSFGNVTLNLDTLPEYEEVLEEWSLALDEEADLLLYGCDVALDETGNSFVEELSQITKADVSASVDDTGISGDWELETSIGEIEATSVFSEEIDSAYQHDLADGDFGLTDLPDFNNTDFSNTSFDFNNASPDNLTIFAEAGLDFSTVDASKIDNIDFNEVPVEDLSILADAGLGLEPLSPEELSEINLDVLKGLNYVEGVEFSTIDSLNGETTFAQLSNSVTANANLYDYKDPTLNLDSGLTLDQLSRFNQSDFQALDYAFTGDEAFDAEYYLAENIDVREDGVNPYYHYINNGAFEGRDPNATFSSSFYLKEYPDVKDAGVNPLEQYITFSKTDEITRFPNKELKAVGTSSEAIIVASDDLENTDIGAIKSFGEITQTENPEIAFGPATIPIIYYTIAGGIAITAVGIELIRNSSTIEDFIRGSTTYTVSPDNGGIDTSIPPFDTGEIVIVEQESFPNGDRFIENILEGRFEFPDSNEVSFTDNLQSINSGDSLFDDDSLWGDADVVNNPPIPGVSQEAESIANGHAFAKHQEQFPNINTRDDFAEVIDGIINNPSDSKNLERGRTAYWDDATATVVITDPGDTDGGTAYKPDDGKAGFDKLI